MTLDERDLERLGRADLDLEDLPVAPPMDEPEEPAPQPRRRGRPPGSWKPGRQPARVATLKERMAAMKARQADRPGAPAGPVSPPANDEAASDDNLSDPAPIVPEIIPIPPAEPDQESTVSTEQWISTQEALQRSGWTRYALETRVKAGRMESKLGERIGRSAAPRLFRADQIAELAGQARPKVGRAKQEPRQAPARGAQPGRSEVKAKPRPAAPSVPVAAMVAAHVTVTHVGGTLSPFLDALADLVGVGLLSQAKADRVLAVLLEG